MKKIVVRKDVDTIVIENDRYSPEVQCVDCGINIDIGVNYIYLQYSEAIWFENYYVDQSNRINQFTEDQVSTLRQIVENWEQPLGQEGNLTPEQQAEVNRDKAMMQGFTYNGVQISVTKEDGDGMMQVEATFKRLRDAITKGELPSETEIKTVIHFKNGTKLPIIESEFNSFSLLFIIERGKFFQ